MRHKISFSCGLVFCVARLETHENDLINLNLFFACDCFLVVFASSNLMVAHMSQEREGSYCEQVVLDTMVIQMII